MTRILVTGGAGYIGSCLIPLLLEKNFQVTVLDNFYYGQASLNTSCINKNLTLVYGDVRDSNLVKSLIKKNDIIIPLAALVGAPICKKKEFEAQTINLDSVKNLIKFTSPSQPIIMPTTNSAYGKGEENNFCNEESPLNPISKYAKDKVEIEKILMNRENFISFRLATVFGLSNRMRLDLLVNDFAYRAFYDKYIVLFEGSFKRNYIHVRDVAKAFVHSLDNYEKMKQNVYNVGLSNANLSKIELCQLIQKIIPDFIFSEAENRKDPDQRNYIVSNEKIESILFTTEYSLDRGIKELIKGYTMLKNSLYGNV